MRRILDGGRDRWTVEIVVLAFICASVADPDIRGIREVLPGLSLHAVLAIVALYLLLVAGIWVLIVYVVSAIATFVGRVFDGQGEAADVRAAVAWGLLPVIWSVVYRIPLAFYRYRFDVYEPDKGRLLFEFVKQGGCTVAVIVMALHFVVEIWVLFVASHTLAEAHRFSSAKGFATLAISVALPVAVIAAAVYAFKP